MNVVLLMFINFQIMQKWHYMYLYHGIVSSQILIIDKSYLIRYLCEVLIVKKIKNTVFDHRHRLFL